jgi:aspartate/tyrosine/aromatic aminotransferase
VENRDMGAIVTIADLAVANYQWASTNIPQHDLYRDISSEAKEVVQEIIRIGAELLVLDGQGAVVAVRSEVLKRLKRDYVVPNHFSTGVLPTVMAARALGQAIFNRVDKKKQKLEDLQKEQMYRDRRRAKPDPEIDESIKKLQRFIKSVYAAQF